MKACCCLSRVVGGRVVDSGTEDRSAQDIEFEMDGMQKKICVLLCVAAGKGLVNEGINFAKFTPFRSWPDGGQRIQHQQRSYRFPQDQGCGCTRQRAFDEVSLRAQEEDDCFAPNRVRVN